MLFFWSNFNYNSFISYFGFYILTDYLPLVILLKNPIAENISSPYISETDEKPKK
jgi:hypothetical protein